MLRFAPLAAVLAVLTLALGAPPAAGASGSREDRAAAREFSFAAYRLRVAAKGLGTEAELRRAQLGSESCGGAGEGAPRRLAGEVGATYFAAYAWLISDALRPAMESFMAELERVPVRDRKLRSGRAAWRLSARAVQDLPPVPPDLCAQFARWRDSGYAKETRPAIPVASVALGDADLAAWQRKLTAAARRMRAFGVSRSAARRFTGANLFAGLPGASAGASKAGSAAVDDRATARELSFAAYRLRVAVKARGPELARRQREISGCSDVFEKAPRRARRAATELYFAAVGLALLDGVREPLAVFVAELDRIPVDDAALRRGRTAWRHNVADLETIAPVPPDVCDQFERWRAAGYTRATRPAVDTEGLARVVEDGEATDRRDRRLRAAVRRMRELGVRRSAAERFTGEELLDGIPELEIALAE